MKLSPRVLMYLWTWDVLGLSLFEGIFDAWKTQGSGPGVCSIEVFGAVCLNDASSLSITASAHLVTLLCSFSAGVDLIEACRSDKLGTRGFWEDIDEIIVEVAKLLNRVLSSTGPFDYSIVLPPGTMSDNGFVDNTT